MEAETIHGTGGVVITSESRRGDAAAVPAKMAADEVTGAFGAGSALRTMVGTGHAQMEQTTATGAQQTANGDRLEVQFCAACCGARQGASHPSGQKSPAGDPGREQGNEGARKPEHG